MKKLPFRTFRYVPTAVLAGLVMSLVVAGWPVVSVSPSGAQLGHGSDAAAAAAPNHLAVSPLAALPLAPVLNRSGWTATASDAEPTDGAASMVLDGNPATLWHSQWRTKVPPLPHWITIDMKVAQPVAGLRYTPRQTGALNGTIGQFRVETSTDNQQWTRVGTGTWADDRETKAINFATTTARYVRLTGITEAGGRGQWSSAAELNLLGKPMDTPFYSRTGWTVQANSADASKVAANVLDGDPKTFWLSNATGANAELPHSIILDMKVTQPVLGLAYVPRQDGSRNGTIGQFTVQVSTDATNWTGVAKGTWPDTLDTKLASFDAPVSARYIRFVARSEAGGRTPWTAASELNVVRPVTTPTTPPPTTPAPTAVAGMLSRTGWTASASSQETQAVNNSASMVLDGNTRTFWSTKRTGGFPAFPQWIRLDLKTAQTFSGLRYTPRTDGTPNGNIGDFTIDVSDTGASYTPVASGTWADTSAAKTVRFGHNVTARYVRLVARSEAGNRGLWAIASELNLLNPTVESAPATGGAAGKWGSTIGFPLVPSAVALLPGNKMLVWSASAAMTYGAGGGYTQTAILDLATGTVGQRLVTETGHDMFCPGVAVLPDGRIMVTGGSSAAKTSIYNPKTNTWASGPNMTTARGYHSMTTLGSGQVFTIGGSWSGGVGNKSAEIYTEGTGWKALPGISAEKISTNDPRGAVRADNHAWLNVLSGGRILQSGPAKTMHWISTSGNGSLTSAGTRADSGDAMNGNAVMYDVNKILTVGGAPAYDNSLATERAYTINASGAQPVVTRTGDLAQARAFGNAVVLPNGEVLVLGGQSYAAAFTDSTAALRPEIWSPATGKFTQLATGPTPRTYHSVAVLLPDGRVFSGGGGLCGSCATNHADGEIFTPPYLLNADGSARTRPQISSAPGTARTGTTIAVTTRAAVKSFALVRYGESTHTVNNNQRRVPVRIASSSGNTYQLALSSDKSVLLPGPYLLFAMDAAGTPSVAKTVVIS